ncbi:hypothetical protein B0H19DRAFT_905037, partial [Mycena capillaripes]
RHTLALGESPHPDRSSSLHNLDTAVQTRFRKKGDIGDFNVAMKLYKEAVAFCEPPHPYRGTVLEKLAICL